jgi:uncharacterized surface protein with fasciclin (FAS1) repeats
MFSNKKKLVAAIALSLAGAFTLAGCSMGATDTAEEAPVTESESSTMENETMDPAANLVGSGCAAYAEAYPSGPGSVESMSKELVAVAASNSPILSTLAAAVSGQLNPNVNLVETLNGSEFTVFAPVDDAFAKIDAATIETLKTDSDLLSKILTYHVVPGQILPKDIAGMHTTVQGSDLEVTGSGDALMVNDSTVICGGVMTKNATVYLIDTVLMPAN